MSKDTKSKSLKKLIDINRLREFKNKLVGAGSAYVQTTAVDQTIAGTKTFSKPIVGSVTGSSGSCTGNAATATRAVNADHATKADSATRADSATTATNATYANWLRTASHPDYLFSTEWDGAYFWTHVTDPAGSYVAVRVARSDSAATAEACTGNAATATNASHATSADSATKAIILKSNSSANHDIRFDWSRQVSGHVGIRVDATDLGGIVTTDTLVPELGSIGVYDIGSTIHACTGVQMEYGETVAGSALKYAAMDAGGGIYDLGHQLTTVGTWLKVSGNSGNTGGFGLYRRIA